MLSNVSLEIRRVVSGVRYSYRTFIDFRNLTGTYASITLLNPCTCKNSCHGLIEIVFSSSSTSALNTCQNLLRIYIYTETWTLHKLFIYSSGRDLSISTHIFMWLPFDFRFACFNNHFTLMTCSSMSDHHLVEFVPWWHARGSNNHYVTAFVSIWPVLFWSQSAPIHRISGEQWSDTWTVR